MNKNTLARSRHCFLWLTTLALALCFASLPSARATLTYSGSVKDLAGDPWPGSGFLVIGYAGNASMLLNDHIDGNGITQLNCLDTYVGYGTGVTASLSIRGSGSTLNLSSTIGESGDIFVGEGVDSRGTLTFSDGFQWINPDYTNRHIYIGRGAGSHGQMFLTDPGTKLHLADWLLVAHLEGSHGRLVVENGAVCEAKNNYIGFRADTVGEVVVTGPGSRFEGWGNSANHVGRLGHGTLIVQDGGMAVLRALGAGYATGSYGEILVTGAGSRLENYYSDIYIGLGAGSGTEPGVGVLRLARGGVLYTDQGINVGYGGNIPKGTMVFTIGNDGGGSIIPGRAEIDGGVRLNIATLLMEVDAGIGLTLGQQFVLVDYLTLNATHGEFQNVSEGGIILTPNHHAFQINYATDFDLGPDVDLAITATVVAPPTTDSDGDSLIDAWEIRCFGATDDPLADPTLDPDGDGRDTACEHAAGTDPLDPNSRCLTELTDTPVGAPWDLAYSPYEEGVTYSVERATSLVGPWSEVTPTGTTIDGETILFTLPADTAGQAFYHIRIER